MTTERERTTHGNIDQIDGSYLLYGKAGRRFVPIKLNLDGEIVMPPVTINNLWTPKLVAVPSEKIVFADGGYTANDVVSEAIASATPWEFKECVRKNGGGGIIHDALILAESTAIASQFALFLHNDTPTCELDDEDQNTAFIIADIAIAVVRIEFPACDDIGTGMSETLATPSTVGNLPKAFVCNPNSRSLFGVLTIKNALDLANDTKLRIVLMIEQF